MPLDYPPFSKQKHQKASPGPQEPSTTSPLQVPSSALFDILCFIALWFGGSIRALLLFMLLITYLISQVLFYLYFFADLHICRNMKVTLSFKVDSRIKDAILKLAEAENRSLSNYVVTMIMRYLQEHEIDWRQDVKKRQLGSETKK